MHQLVEIHRHRVRYRLHAAEPLHPAHDLRAVLRGALDDVERAPHALLLHLAQQQLHPAQDDREEVVEVVRHAGGELAHRAQRLAADELGLGRLEVVDHPLQLGRGGLRLLQQAGVVDRVADVGHERVQELQIGRAKRGQPQRVRHGAVAPLRHVDNADDPIAHPDRHADERPVAVLRIVRPVEARIGRDVVDQHRLAHLDDLAGHSLADLHLDLGDDVVGDAPGGGELQHRPLAVENHDGAHRGPDRAHGGLQHQPEQVLDARDPRGQLDHLVQGAELEDQILESLSRAAQVVQHVVERVPHLADLGDLAQAGHRRGPLHAPERLRLRLGGRDEALSQRRDLIHHAAEHQEAQDGDPDRGGQSDLCLAALQQLVTRHQVDHHENRQQRDQREDHRGRLAEAHGSGPGPVVPHGVLP